MCVGPASGCGGVLNLTQNGTVSISSPDVDNDGQYEPDLDCVWKVISGVNRVVSLQFSRFVLHDDESALCPDYVEVISSVISATLPANTSICDTRVGIVLLFQISACRLEQERRRKEHQNYTVFRKMRSVHFFLYLASVRILSWR